MFEGECGEVWEAGSKRLEAGTFAGNNEYGT
jgi:hypothetical protein